MFDFKALLAAAAANVSFLLVCLVVFAGLVVIAKLAEVYLLRYRPRWDARRISVIAIFAAMAAILMYFEFPLPFAPPFYQVDLSEVPVLICSFSLGPVAGVVCELLKIVLKLFLKGTSTAFVGDFANFVIGCTFLLPAAIVYYRRKTKKTALAGMVVGALVMTTFGSLFNAVYLIPAFSKLYEMPLETIVGMGTAINGSITNVTTLVLFAVVPFNLVKSLVQSVLTFLLYKHIERFLRLRQ